MLTSIGRAAIKRLAASAAIRATSSRQVAISQARVIRASGPFQHPNASVSGLGVVRGFASQAQVKATAKTSEKKTPKTTATAAKKTTKPKAKATTAKPKAKATTKAKVKAKAKSKAKPKAKAKAKSGSKPRRKKVLSDEAKGVLQRRVLRKTALFDEPKGLPDVPWQLFVAEQRRGQPTPRGTLGAVMPQVAAAFKSLPSSEIQRLQDVAKQNKLSNEAAYKAWVASHTPVEVDAANRARKFLKRKYGIPKGMVKLIADERLPKRPKTAYALFTKDRWSSGDLGSVGIREATTTVAGEWKKLPETEKKVYIDRALLEHDRYEKEVKSVLGRELTPPRG